MKNYRPYFIVVFVLVLTLLAGCGPLSVVRGLDSAEEAIENRVEAVENSAEQAVKDALSDVPPQPEAALTEEEAKAIALEHAGFAAEQVTGLRAQFDRDRIDHYDVEFRNGRLEYEYEIDAATGDILSWDKDD